MSRETVWRDSSACEQEEAAQESALGEGGGGQHHARLGGLAEKSSSQEGDGHDPRGKITTVELQHHTYDMVVKARLAPSVDDLLQGVVDTLVRALGVDYCELLELTDDGQWFMLRAGSGFDEGTLGTHVGIHLESQAGYTLLRRRPVTVADLEVEDRFDPTRLLVDHAITSGVTVPLIYHSDECHVYGVLGVHSRSRRTFNQREVAFLEEAAAILGEAECRRREDSGRERELQLLREKAERLAQDELFLREALEVLRVTQDMQMVADCAVQLAVTGLADWAFVDLLDEGAEGAGIRRCAVAYKGDTDEAEEISKELLGHYPIDLTARQGTARVYWTRRRQLIAEVDNAVVRSVAQDQRSLDAIRRLRATSYLGVPLLHRDGRLLGILSLVRSSNQAVTDLPFNADDENLAENLAGVVSMALTGLFAGTRDTAYVEGSTVASPPSAQPSNPDLTEVSTETQASEPAAPGAGAHQTAPKDQDGERLQARKMLSQLSPRQRQVFERLAQLKSDREMSEEFVISPETVKSHVLQIRNKLGLSTRDDAVRIAQRIFYVSGEWSTD